MQANPVSGSANADVLHRFVAAFNAKDEDALGKILTPDVVDHHLPPGLPAGIDGLKTWLGIVWAAFDAKLNLDDVVAAGDRVASRWTFAGTRIGEFNGLPASGREFSVQGMSIEHIADGRIAERWETADLLSLLQQINPA